MKSQNYTVPMIIGLVQYRSKVAEQTYYTADLVASEMIMDLDVVLHRANLTAKQQFILDNYWGLGYTQEEVARMMSITQQMVEKHCRAIKKKIKAVLTSMGEIPAETDKVAVIATSGFSGVCCG